MVSVKLFTKSDKVPNKVACDDDIAFNERRHLGFFEIFDDFYCSF